MAGDEAVVAPRKGGTGTTAAQAPAAAPAGDEAQQAGLRCPRCDSPNTKFCYYNNYSLSQPRHFCKTCRRYWTKGGALRNVPVGGGCRKNKRSRSSASSAASSRLSLNLPGGPDQQQQQQNDQQQQAAVRMGGGFHGVVDFHPGISMLPGPGGLQLHSSSPTSAVVSHGQYGPFGEWPAPGDVNNNNNISGRAGHGMSGGGGSIASSIESLSYINQDLHWKLQQQRVATMFLGPPIAADAQAHHHHHQFGAGAAAFLQMETTTAVPAAATSWFMDSSSSYAPAPLQPNSSSSPCRPPAAASCSNINSGRSSGGGGGGGDVDNATSNNNNCGGSDNIPSWGDISTFAMLP